MRFNLAILLFAIATSYSHAQFGVNVIYQAPSSSSEWDAWVNDNSFQESGIGASLDYWFRLKNYRVEFLAEASYVVGQNDHGYLVSDWSELGLGVMTNVYIFDFEGDCNCPTWGKDGSLFEKGFYVQAGAGLNMLSAAQETDIQDSDGTEIAPVFHAGIGLDIGLGEYLTVTPWVRYRYRLSMPWPGLENEFNQIWRSDVESSSQGFLAGIRLGYRWDYKKRY